MPLLVCKVLLRNDFFFHLSYRAGDWAIAKRSRKTIRCEDGVLKGTGFVGEQICQFSESRLAPKGSVLLDVRLPLPRLPRSDEGPFPQTFHAGIRVGWDEAAEVPKYPLKIYPAASPWSLCNNDVRVVELMSLSPQ